MHYKKGMLGLKRLRACCDDPGNMYAVRGIQLTSAIKPDIEEICKNAEQGHPPHYNSLL